MTVRERRAPTLGVVAPARTAPALNDPLRRFPQPPFPEQTQTAPGLAAKMDPRPDHGERSYRGIGRLAGRKALITGGDSGIGRAVAIAYAREGASVVVNYLPQEEKDAAEVIELLRSEGHKVYGIAGDISNEAFCNKLVQAAAARLGGLDLMALVAGRQVATDSILELSTEQFDQTFKTNVYAMFWLCKAALPLMPAGSAIVNTASIQSYAPSANLLDYASTKATIVAFTKALARQAADRGVRVNAVAPGPVWTPLQPSGGQPPEKIPQFGAQTPLHRPGQPIEVAPVYVLLASNEASYITGETYGVTGGNPLP